MTQKAGPSGDDSGGMVSGSGLGSREPTREEIDRLRGPVVLEFGAVW
jgi:hypothetical protein